MVHRPGQFSCIFPIEANEEENVFIWLKIGSDWPFFALASHIIADQLPQGGSQCFPFYTYAEDGSNRRENITDWALEQFRIRYGDRSITKWDIFHYIYAVLHHPEYRERYAANLRRELPRIPFAAASSSTTLSSRAESRDPASAGTEHRLQEEFSAPTSSARVRRKNASQGQGEALRDMGSFDSVNELAREFVPSAQDDRVGIKSDLECFRAVVKAGQRLAEIHVTTNSNPNTHSPKEKKKAKSSTIASPKCV